MVQIIADTEELKWRSHSVFTAADRIRSDCATVRVVTNPADIFVGRVSESYQIAHSEYCAAAAKLIDSLERLGRWLTSAAAATEAIGMNHEDGVAIG